MDVWQEIKGQLSGVFRRVFADFPDPKFSENPLTVRPLASIEEYEALALMAANETYPEIDWFEKYTGYTITREWLQELALHTQVVVKSSPLCYAHGRVLYSALSRYLESASKFDSINILETGTARGFSSLCMARALNDMDRPGKVVTFDILPHRLPIYWNCIDDFEGKKSRQELLSPWTELVQKYLIFVQGDTRRALPTGRHR